MLEAFAFNVCAKTYQETYSYISANKQLFFNPNLGGYGWCTQ